MKLPVLDLHQKLILEIKLKFAAIFSGRRHLEFFLKEGKKLQRPKKNILKSDFCFEGQNKIHQLLQKKIKFAPWSFFLPFIESGFLLNAFV